MRLPGLSLAEGGGDQLIDDDSVAGPSGRGRRGSRVSCEGRAAPIIKGLEVPPHSTEVGSSIASDKHYDRVVLFPGTTQGCFTGNIVVLDYDGVIFKDLWATRGKKDFNAYLRYYMSDHRPLWFH